MKVNLPVGFILANSSECHQFLNPFHPCAYANLTILLGLISESFYCLCQYDKTEHWLSSGFLNEFDPNNAKQPSWEIRSAVNDDDDAEA